MQSALCCKRALGMDTFFAAGEFGGRKVGHLRDNSARNLALCDVKWDIYTVELGPDRRCSVLPCQRCRL